MILTGPEIVRQRKLGQLTIEPFAAAQLNPVSYNYRLSKVVRTHRTHLIDTHAGHELDEFSIPMCGSIFYPGRVYLCTTMEVIGSDVFVPSLIGRSSLGRLGMFLQYSADMGNLGCCHQWTLEIKVVQPIRVYAGMAAGQVTFWSTVGVSQDYIGHFGRINEATIGPRNQLTCVQRSDMLEGAGT